MQAEFDGAIVGGVVGALPIYADITQVRGEFDRAAGILAGTSPESEVAILHDYDSRWAIDFQAHSNRYDQIVVLLGYYRALRDIRYLKFKQHIEPAAQPFKPSTPSAGPVLG